MTLQSPLLRRENFELRAFLPMLVDHRTGLVQYETRERDHVGGVLFNVRHCLEDVCTFDRVKSIVTVNKKNITFLFPQFFAHEQTPNVCRVANPNTDLQRLQMRHSYLLCLLHHRSLGQLHENFWDGNRSDVQCTNLVEGNQTAGFEKGVDLGRHVSIYTQGDDYTHRLQEVITLEQRLQVHMGPTRKTG